MRLCTDTRKSLHWKLTLGEKSLAAPENRACVSGVTVHALTNWATSPLSHMSSNLGPVHLAVSSCRISHYVLPPCLSECNFMYSPVACGRSQTALVAFCLCGTWSRLSWWKYKCSPSTSATDDQLSMNLFTREWIILVIMLPFRSLIFIHKRYEVTVKTCRRNIS